MIISRAQDKQEKTFRSVFKIIKKKLDFLKVRDPNRVFNQLEIVSYFVIVNQTKKAPEFFSPQRFYVSVF